MPDPALSLSPGGRASLLAFHSIAERRLASPHDKLTAGPGMTKRRLRLGRDDRHPASQSRLGRASFPALRFRFETASPGGLSQKKSCIQSRIRRDRRLKIVGSPWNIGENRDCPCASP